MATTDTLHAPKLGEAGEPCAACGTPLAEDQRYCLNCGRRRAEARVPFMDVLAAGAPGGPAPPEAATAPAAPSGGPPSRVTPLAAVTAVSAVVVALAAGVIIGHQDDEGKSSKPQVITVGAAGGTGTNASAANTTFVDDWPEGKNGFTVQLQALSKDGTQPAAVATAKSDAEGKGAKDVGALDSDTYQSLAPGNYVVYSGVYAKKADATKALKGLKGKFPGAKVVEVSTGQKKGDPDALSGKRKEATVDRQQLQQLQNLSPSEYQKKANKLPDTTKLPGKPPPTDNKAPGGGSDTQVIK
jgi:hypothetical protein